jgi:ATP-grasp domain
MRHAVLVDPYAGASEYGPAFHARQVATIAVLSTPQPLASFAAGWFPDKFDEVWTFDGDLPALVARLRATHPLCVLPGNESAVELAEVLTEQLVPGIANTPGGSAARRDKWHMAQALKRAGVPVIRQLCSKDPDEITDWLRDTGLRDAQLVLKPPKSGGTDDVYMIEPGQDWRPVFEHLLSTVNRFEACNEAVLVQEFVTGIEYAVNTYTVAGRHGLADMCQYTKATLGERLGVYLRIDFLPSDHPQASVLFDYACQIADALGIRNGSAHAEIMLTRSGPRLIEVGARLAGTPLQYGARLATGDCQIDRAVRHLLDSEFTAGYTLGQHVTIAYLRASRAGVLRNAEVLAGVHQLGSAQHAHLPYRTGAQVPATADLFTTLGWVVLASPDKVVVDTDYVRLRELERQIVID